MGATSASAHRAYGFMMSRTGRPQEAVAGPGKPTNSSVRPQHGSETYGYTLILAANYADGRPVIEHAIELSPAHPSWWDYGLFLGSFMLATSTVPPLLPNPWQRRNARITSRRGFIVADLTGKRDAVVPLLKELMREFPKFAADPTSHFGSINILRADREVCRRPACGRSRQRELSCFALIPQ